MMSNPACWDYFNEVDHKECEIIFHIKVQSVPPLFSQEFLCKLFHSLSSELSLSMASMTCSSYMTNIAALKEHIQLIKPQNFSLLAEKSLLREDSNFLCLLPFVVFTCLRFFMTIKRTPLRTKFHENKRRRSH